MGLKLTDANQSNSDLRVCSLHGLELIRQDIAWTTSSGTKMLDSFTFQVPNPAGEKSPMKQKSPGSTSKGIGETRIALKQIGQANDILRNQQGHEHFSHIDLAMYNVTRDAMHEENDENAPQIDPQIAFELGLPPKADGKRNTKNYFGNPEKATNAGDKPKHRRSGYCAQPQMMQD